MSDNTETNRKNEIRMASHMIHHQLVELQKKRNSMKEELDMCNQHIAALEVSLTSMYREVKSLEE